MPFMQRDAFRVFIPAPALSNGGPLTFAVGSISQPFQLTPAADDPNNPNTALLVVNDASNGHLLLSFGNSASVKVTPERALLVHAGQSLLLASDEANTALPLAATWCAMLISGSRGSVKLFRGKSALLRLFPGNDAGVNPSNASGTHFFDLVQYA